MNLIEIHPWEPLLREYLKRAPAEFPPLALTGWDGYHWMPFFHPIIPLDISESIPLFTLDGTHLLAWRRLTLEERGFEAVSFGRRVEKYGCAVTDSRPSWTDYPGFGHRSEGGETRANNRNSS